MFAGPGSHKGFQQPQYLLKCNTEGHRQSRRFLECTNDNFLMQLAEELKGDTLLDLKFTGKEELLGL